MMMTEHNYEEYALDYLEGNLEPAQQQAMELFLSTRPDIAAELHGLETVVLVPDPQVRFEPKARLKKKTGIAWAIGWRLLAVAALLLISIGGTLVYYQQISQDQGQPASRMPVAPATSAAPQVAPTQPQSVPTAPPLAQPMPSETEAAASTTAAEATTPAQASTPVPAPQAEPLAPQLAPEPIQSQTPNQLKTPDQPNTPPAVLDTIQQSAAPVIMAQQEGPTPEAIAPVAPRDPLPTQALTTVEPAAIVLATAGQQEALLQQRVASVEAPESLKTQPAPGIWKQIAQAIVPESFVQSDWN